ncbi:phage baseplate assembly protein V [Aliivibrio finisterrensis]|uniref:Phage baseplate assembly protein V n=1 Tax=Aliivibrio finisterrensis TaxID=511998 RepID=A0ABY0I602_9GAMM|nr:phage baseplate assembly protein V [Aliivibrio finisterrensis]RYU50024.1 phage baseplate assembly protein V [Aliivibrio finisterrensis]RYU55725.1 phage baseplate assembly protein V [Aliivibrio finisterrensis]RYU62179.1 phage baseplate assembly protein V [Aliivibrio finisterrensis]RYU80916.1 phage baseplate assembly protein V [Aliivibrio finisterrensis]RYU84471.1 phage baseplate assembly protein V [Aliivibrio finisterrensis]
MFNRVMNRIKNLFAIGDVTGADTKVLQIKTSTGKINDRIKRLHNYGFMSHPKVGSRSYLLFLGGVRSRGVSFCVEDERHQMELEKGDVAMLDDKGNLIHFTKNGIVIKTNEKVEINAEKDVSVTAGGDILAKGKNIKLNDGTGVITCESICPFTGGPHVDGSSVVFVGKA